MKQLCLLFLLYPIFSFSQSQIYVDEKMNEITKTEYEDKCQAYIYKCLNYKADSIKVNKIHQRYYFGNLNEFELEEIRTFISNSKSQTIDKDQIIIVRFHDTLKAYNSYSKRIDIINEKQKKRRIESNNFYQKFPRTPKLTEKGFIRKHNSFIKNQKRCIRKFQSDYNAILNYYYKIEIDNHNQLFPDLNWTKDIGVFGPLFFPYGMKAGFLIIKPDGNYFVSHLSLSNKQIYMLLQNDWQSYKEDVIAMTNTKSKAAIGFFITPHSHNKKKCF